MPVYIINLDDDDHLVTTWLTSCSMKDAESAQFTLSSCEVILKNSLGAISCLIILLDVLFLASDICAGLYCWLPCDDGVTICDDVAPRRPASAQMVE